MNHAKEDKRIEQLFRQLRQQDEQRTPSFARMWANAARSQTETRRQPVPMFRFAVAMVLLLVFAGSAFIIYRQGQQNAFQSTDSITQWQSPTRNLLEFSREKASPRNQYLIATNNSRGITRTLSSWQSPTASLGHTGLRRFKKYHKHLL